MTRSICFCSDLKCVSLKWWDACSEGSTTVAGGNGSRYDGHEKVLLTARPDHLCHTQNVGRYVRDDRIR